MLQRLAAGVTLSLMSSAVIAQTMVIYPSAAIDSSQPSPANQSVTLHSVPLVQTNPWLTYFANLRNCIPGTYSLSQVDPQLINQYGDIMVTQIIEKKNDKCEVTITYKAVYPVVTPANSPLTLDCKFSAEAIELIVGHYSRFVQGAQTTTVDENAYTQHMQNDCRRPAL